MILREEGAEVVREKVESVVEEVEAVVEGVLGEDGKGAKEEGRRDEL